jgi:hypothetical protein
MDRFSMDDYLALSSNDRNRFDEWLNECGAHAERTREVQIDGNEVITIEWVVDRQGKLVYNYKLKDVETTEIRNRKVGEPPCWKHPQ